MATDVESYDSLWLGIDLGTTSVKVVIVDDNRKVIQSSSCPTAAELKSVIGSLGYEQDPRKILSTVEELVCPLMNKFKDKIRALDPLKPGNYCVKAYPVTARTGIGVTGQMHGVVMWRRCCNYIDSLNDLDHLYVSNLYTWQDQRCTREFLDTLPRASDFHQTLSTGHGCVTMFWLSRNQTNYFQDAKFTSCGTIMDLLVSVLCGQEHSVTSDQLAASLGYFNKTNSAWDSVLYESQGFPHHLLPTIIPAGSCVGHVSASLSKWPSNIPVYVAMGDVQCSMYTMLKDSTDAAINISTSIQLGFIIPAKDDERVRQQSPPSISFFPYFHGRLLALCAGLNGGNAISHFVECLVQWSTDLGFSGIIDATSLMSRLQKLAEDDESSDDPSPLTASPVFFGERHDTGLSGHISGINAINFRRVGTIFKAVCRGVVDHLQDMVPVRYLLDKGITRLLVSGSVPVNNYVVKRRLVELYTSESLTVVIDEDDYSVHAAASAVGAARVIREYAKTLKSDYGM